MLIVGTRDLHSALTAVLPHVSRETDLYASRVRLRVDRVNLTIAATDFTTVALAVVSVHDVADDMVGETLDLSAGSVKKLLAVHAPVKRPKSEELEEEQTVGLTVEDGSLTSRDVSGLFPGEESLQVPLLDPSEDFPDVARYLGGVVHRHDTNTSLMARGYAGDALVTGTSRLAAFGAAARAYGKPLALRVIATESAASLLVTVGDSFLGQSRLELPDVDGERHVDVLEAWQGWLDRLAPAATGEAPSLRVVKGGGDADTE